MGEDNIAPGRQSFLEDGMEKWEDTHLLREHALPQLSRQKARSCRNVTSTDSGKQSTQEQQFACLHEPRESKLKGTVYTISTFSGHNEEVCSRRRHTYKVWSTRDAALKVSRELQNGLVL